MSLMGDGGHKKLIVNDENKTELECNGNSSNLSSISLRKEDKITMEIKSYVDMKIKEATIAINEKLTEMEMRQNEKLDRILKLLESRQ